MEGSMNVLNGRLSFVQWASRALLFGSLLVSLGAAGCAAENKITKGPNFSLNHPEFWKVKEVASKPGDATKLGIGRFSETVVNEGTGADHASAFEASQAEVDARIVTWVAQDDAGDPTKKVANLLVDTPDLELTKQGRLATDKGECGAQFVKKYTWKGQTLEPLDLFSKPGFRSVIVGAKSEGVLLGVLARVPTEPDPGLFCHNLRNMQTQLQLLLEGLTVVPGDAAAPPGTAAPAAATPTAGPPPEPTAAK
jgi:hypothetical protein